MKNVLVFLADGCEMCEALCVVDVLRSAGINVVTAGGTGERVVSSHKVEIKADVLLSEVKNAEWDLVFAPGGMRGATNLASSELVNVVINEGTTTILNEAFSHCHTLKDIWLPKSLTDVATSAFRGCTKLENIYYNSTINDFYKLNITIDMIDSDSINVHCTDEVITFYG